MKFEAVLAKAQGILSMVLPLAVPRPKVRDYYLEVPPRSRNANKVNLSSVKFAFCHSLVTVHMISQMW